ncbi:MAG: gluconate 2-dehydrogenase subunit 3 family protein [Anaerolineae bacterium]
MPMRMRRREFIKAVGSVGVMTVVVGGLEACQSVVPTSTVAPSAESATQAVKATSAPTAKPTTATTAAPTASPTVAPAAANLSDVYLFFTPTEGAFIDAAVAQLIPKDNLGDGALEAGATWYIDHQLAGNYGYNARHYISGPWLAGTPEQGYQARYNPREIYRIGIAEVNAYCMTTFKNTFDKITAAQQTQVLTDLQGSKIKLATIESTLFFNTLLQDTRDGFFSDPAYGGNKDKVGWLLIGYPGVPPGYTDWITKYGAKYTGPTQSMADAVGM